MIKKTSHQLGFSIIELMIVIAISAILSTVMFNSYQGHVRKSRRADAHQTLISMQLAEERYRTSHKTYGDLSDAWGGTTTSSNGLYTLSITGNTATAYSLTAVATGNQATDSENGTPCTPLTISVSNGTTNKTPAVCW